MTDIFGDPTWFGGTGNFYNPNNWDPVGVPGLAYAQTGTIKVTNHTNDATFYLDGTSKATQPVLQLTNDAMQGTIAGLGIGGGSGLGKIDISGDVSSSGEINSGAAHTYSGSVTIHIDPHSTFENTGDIDVGVGPVTINGAASSVFVNDGQFNVGEGSSGYFAAINTRVIGTGSFVLQSVVTVLDFSSSVAKGISVVYSGGVGTEVDPGFRTGGVVG